MPTEVYSVGGPEKHGRAETVCDNHEVSAEVAEFRADHNADRNYTYVHHRRESDEPFRVSLPGANQPTGDGAEQGHSEIKSQQGVE